MKKLILWLMQTNRTKRPKSVVEVFGELCHRKEELDKSNTEEETIIATSPHRMTQPEEERVESDIDEENAPTYEFDEDEYLDWYDKIKIWLDNDPGLKWVFVVFGIIMVIILVIAI